MNGVIQVLIPLIILGVLGGVFGLLLSFAAKKFAVKVDEKVVRMQEALPGANCGGCGFPGCAGYAEAVAKGEAKIGLCTPGGEKAANAMSEIMGVAAEGVEKKVAVVQCAGSSDKAERRFKYYGIKSCLEAATIPGGSVKECRFGCLGYGSCSDVCNFDAIHMENGVAKIDETKCTGCGSCAKICPKHVITLVPAGSKIVVQCSNKLKGLEVKGTCKVGCLGCGLCARNCPEKAIVMKDNLPQIDHSLCTGCGTCTQKCPVHAIVFRNGSVELAPTEE